MPTKHFCSCIRIGSYRLIISLISIATILSPMSQRAVGEDIPYCFMEDSQGNLINLNGMCGVSSINKQSTIAPSPISQFQPQKKPSVQITQEKLGGFAYIYAEQYCDWREAGGRSRNESKNSAIKKLTDMIIQLYGVDGANQVVDRLDVNFFKTTDRLIQQICPKHK
ncbi:hypothetical protein [Nostoc sp. TCL26-01]|uniref:hypothetical protein n=1 Tax=Nostoc sp. TCL26-01 TaxID=2576904 RepID=UPI0015BDD85B|nr:hypothetical protein [Nostoc sp. TCL26-01]QLE54524.1 hypothetical protein FD725_02740 [Nostoc sp. TCL26-01]